LELTNNYVIQTYQNVVWFLKLNLSKLPKKQAAV